MFAARSRSWRAGAGTLSWLLGLLLLIGGCAAVPLTGPVEHHTPAAPGVDPGVRVDPLPPADGASQLLVVEGFLHAMGTYQPDYEVARQYLTEEASHGWHPESGVQIYDSSTLPSQNEQSVVLSARVTGEVDAAGTYASAAADSPPLRQDFGLVENSAGQWRISKPPKGLLVSEYVFTTGFTSVSLFFSDPDGSVLVPEPRVFAAGEQTPRTAVAALLDGPSRWLAPAVAKSPTEPVTLTGLRLNAGGAAELELNGTADLTAEQRRMLLAQLTYTLTGFTQIHSVQVSADGQTWRDDSGSPSVTPSSFSRLSASGMNSERDLYLIRDKVINRLNDPTNWDDLTRVDVGVSRPEQIAVNADGEAVATVTGGATRISVSQADSDKVTAVRTGEALLRPIYSRKGELWSASAGALEDLQIFRDGEPLRVKLSRAGSGAIPQRKVAALALAPDGVRAALLLVSGDRSEIGLVRIQRSDGEVSLGGWQPIRFPMITGNDGPVEDLGWVSATELVLLQGDDEGTGVLRVAQNGSVSTDIGPSEPTILVQLAVSPGRTIVALTSTGSLLRRDGDFNWNLAVTGVSSVCYSA